MADTSTTPTSSETDAAHERSEARARETERENQTYWSLVKRQYRKNRGAMIALYFLAFMFTIAILADFLANDRPIACSFKGEFYSPVFHDYLASIGIAPAYPAELSNPDWKSLEYDWSIFPPVPYSSSGADLLNSYAPPFAEGSDHYLGADQLGRDMLAGLIHGARISLSIGLVSMAIAGSIGIVLGAMAGYFGGWVDIAISRVVELFLNFPQFFLIITIVSFYDAKIWYVMVILGVTGWMGIARLVRGEVLRVRNMEYIAAANSVGFGSSKIIFRHVLPNSLAPVLVSLAFGVASAILAEAALSFLGFGVPATVVTWGSTLNQARGNISAWWLAIFPGMMIFLTVLSYNLIGDALRDATDPRLKN